LRGSLHGIDGHWLQAARQRHPAIAALPAPRHALLLGGPTRDCPWQLEQALEWIACLRRWRTQQGGSLLLLGSPRTPASMYATLREASADFDLCWLAPADGDAAPAATDSADNPYPGVLACAEVLLVSPDSTNLLSEACATEAAVAVPREPAQHGRIAQLQASLRAARRIDWMQDSAPPATPQVPLRETERVAREVIRALRLSAHSS
jgi:mitochondrial fission protein ELM1